MVAQHKKKVPPRYKRRKYESPWPQCRRCWAKKPGPWCTCSAMPYEYLMHDFIYDDEEMADPNLPQHPADLKMHDFTDDWKHWGFLEKPKLKPRDDDQSHASPKSKPCTKTPGTLLALGFSRLRI